MEESGWPLPPPPPPPSPSGLKLAAVALVSAFLGGLAAVYLSPLVPLPRRAPAPDARPAPHLEVQPVPPAVGGAPAVAVAEKVGPAVVGVASIEVLRDLFGGRLGRQTGSGSGVIFDPSGYIVTNYHVVEGADRLVVVLAGGERLEAELVGVDPPTDLAVLRVRAGRDLPSAVFGDSDQVRVGEVAIAIGNPLGLEFQRSVTVGVVSGIRSFLYGQSQEMERVTQLIQTDAAINPGNSGGALVNAAGQVIGINTFKVGELAVEGMGFAIPSNTVRRVVDDLVRYGRVRRAYMGVVFMEAAQAREVLGARVDRGLLLATVEAGQPAHAAGLRQGDVILEMDGTPVDRTLEAIRILEERRPGDRVRVRYRRGQEVRETVVTLGERPSR